MTAADVLPGVRLADDSLPPTAFSDAVLAALGTVREPESDEPITAIGIVRSVAIQNREVTVRLRLPIAFCSFDIASLMVSDTYDALQAVPDIGDVRVVLVDHRGSDRIDQGAAAAGAVGSAGTGNQDDLEERRAAFRRRAHLAAMDRCCGMMLRRGTWTIEELPALELLDLPAGSKKSALVRRRRALGLPDEPHARVLVDDEGRSVAQVDLATRLRFARATCPSAEGTAHPCRARFASRPAEPPPATA